MLLATFGATKAASGGPDKNLAEGVGKLIDAYQIGHDLGNELGIERPGSGNTDTTIYECEACGGTFRDSSGTYVPAKGKPTEKIDTHVK